MPTDLAGKEPTMRRIALICTLLASGLASAAPAHVHGLAHLDVSLEGNVLNISMESPLDSLLGFERAPRGNAEIARVRAMAAVLREADRVFLTTPAAGCSLSSVHLSSSALSPQLLGETASKPAATEEPAGHADLDADFSFKCANPAALSSIVVQLFESFPAMKSIDLQLVTPKLQKAAKLSSGARTISWSAK